MSARERQNAGVWTGEEGMKGFLVAGVISMLAGVAVAVGMLRSLELFEALRAGGIFDSVWVGGSGFIGFLALARVRAIGWPRWALATAISSAFAVWYNMAAILAALARQQVEFGGGHAVMLALLCLLAGPALLLHVRILEGCGLVPAPTPRPASGEAKPPRPGARAVAFILIPAALLFFLHVDLLSAAGILPDGRHWPMDFALLPALAGAFGFLAARPANRSHWIVLATAAIVAALSFGLFSIALVAGLLAVGIPGGFAIIAGLFGPMMLVDRALSWTRRLAGPEGPWPHAMPKPQGKERPDDGTKPDGEAKA